MAKIVAFTFSNLQRGHWGGGVVDLDAASYADVMAARRMSLFPDAASDVTDRDDRRQYGQ